MSNDYLFHECDWITFDSQNARTSGSVKWMSLNKRSLVNLHVYVKQSLVTESAHI